MRSLPQERFAPGRASGHLKEQEDEEMAFSQDDVQANREFFAAKLRAEKQKVDVLAKVKKEPGAGDFLLLDVRTRDAFAQGHIAGALSVPLADIPKLAPKLPKDNELVTYCWNHT